jgi:hypothetical protein
MYENKPNHEKVTPYFFENENIKIFFLFFFKKFGKKWFFFIFNFHFSKNMVLL